MNGAATWDLGKWYGGLRLPPEKARSTAQPIREVPVPERLVLPLAQHSGDPAQPVVDVGDRVLKGQLVAAADGILSAPVHASSSGTVAAFQPWPVSRRFGENAPCIVIECDGEDRAIDMAAEAVDFERMEPAALLERILEGGIVGLGGAVFPTAQKLMQARTQPLHTLLVNGVECEPYISCDDMLMREAPGDVLQGARVLLHALGIDKCVVVLESDKPHAWHAMADALAELGDDRISLKQVPTIYPSGGEDQVVQLVTRKEVPSGGLPTDVGCVVQNVGTVAAVWHWIRHGEPLISRVTTVTGDGVVNPMNVRVRLGTPVADVIAFAGGYSERASHLVIGGPMTGKSVTTDRVPVVKATNCILVLSELLPTGDEKPCIRCGECAVVCPVVLQPQELYWYTIADNHQRLRELGLRDCIECGCCDLVCPSHIPLVSYFRKAKARILELAAEKERAERARRRFEARSERLELEERKRREDLAQQKLSAIKAGPEEIRRMVERARGRKDPGE
ncbi:MAG TPA: electron transport complex subunit RsxC [Woeseiaceae bacterium]|nr:electron transport complex subunit RsxC [Woeseiaceae bacterium]